jgi:hypothetical protein
MIHHARHNSLSLAFYEGIFTLVGGVQLKRSEAEERSRLKQSAF